MPNDITRISTPQLEQTSNIMDPSWTELFQDLDDCLAKIESTTNNLAQAQFSKAAKTDSPPARAITDRHITVGEGEATAINEVAQQRIGNTDNKAESMAWDELVQLVDEHCNTEVETPVKQVAQTPTSSVETMTWDDLVQLVDEHCNTEVETPVEQVAHNPAPNAPKSLFSRFAALFTHVPILGRFMEWLMGKDTSATAAPIKEQVEEEVEVPKDGSPVSELKHSIAQHTKDMQKINKRTIDLHDQALALQKRKDQLEEKLKDARHELQEAREPLLELEKLKNTSLVQDNLTRKPLNFVRIRLAEAKVEAGQERYHKAREEATSLKRDLDLTVTNIEMKEAKIEDHKKVAKEELPLIEADLAAAQKKLKDAEKTTVSNNFQNITVKPRPAYAPNYKEGRILASKQHILGQDRII